MYLCSYNKKLYMKIKVTEFAERHFDKDFGGTKILDISKDDFEVVVNIYSDDIATVINEDNCGPHIFDDKKGPFKVMDGYAPFCKLVAIENFTDARVGSMPITLENYQFIRSGYSARRGSELPIFSRWLELPSGFKPKAEWLILVLYDKEQIDTESKMDLTKEFESFEGDWGIVAILGQSHSNEEPMKPETMIRNALGIEEGGSGVPLDREKYLKSVEFWSENITVK